MIIDQSIKVKTIRLLKENTEEYLHDLRKADYLGNKKVLIITGKCD